MNKKNYNVTHRSDGTWAVIRDGADRAASIHGTQAAAIEAGKPLAQRGEGELRIQGRDGRFREAWSYGNDPFPPNG